MNKFKKVIFCVIQHEVSMLTFGVILFCRYRYGQKFLHPLIMVISNFMVILAFSDLLNCSLSGVE